MVLLVEWQLLSCNMLPRTSAQPTSRNINPNCHRRILYAWQNPGVPVDEVMRDILHIFHHPALRDEHLEVHRNMFATVRKWVEEQPDAHNLNNILSSASVKAGRNHQEGSSASKGVHDHDHGALGGHGKTSGSLWSEIRSRDMMSLEGGDYNPNHPDFATGPTQSGSPGFPPPQSPSYGYQNNQSGGGGGYGGRPFSSSGNSYDAPPNSYQAGPVSEYLQDYSGGGGGYQQQQQQPPYGGYGGPPPNQGGYNNAPPYPTEQTYGGQDQYQQGPPQQQWNQGPGQPPYGQQYPPQHQQPPYQGGGGGGYPGAGYGGGY